MARWFGTPLESSSLPAAPSSEEASKVYISKKPHILVRYLCSAITMASKLALLSVLLAVSYPASALWPLPQHLTTGSTPLRLSPNFNIKISIPNPPQDLVAAVSRTKSFLQTDKLERLVVDRGASDATAIDGAKSLNTLTVHLAAVAEGSVKSISDEAVAALESRVEGYTLSVPGDGSDAVLTANSTLGLFRGLTTFGQLWYDLQGTTYTLEAPIAIEDAPAYVCGFSPSFPSPCYIEY